MGNGSDLGHFQVEQLCNVDGAISTDMIAVLSFLGAQPSAVYADALGFDAEMRALVERWRPEALAASGHDRAVAP